MPVPVSIHNLSFLVTHPIDLIKEQKGENQRAVKKPLRFLIVYRYCLAHEADEAHNGTNVYMQVLDVQFESKTLYEKLSVVHSNRQKKS